MKALETNSQRKFPSVNGSDVFVTYAINILS